MRIEMFEYNNLFLLKNENKETTSTACGSPVWRNFLFCIYRKSISSKLVGSFIAVNFFGCRSLGYSQHEQSDAYCFARRATQCNANHNGSISLDPASYVHCCAVVTYGLVGERVFVCQNADFGCSFFCVDFKNQY